LLGSFATIQGWRADAAGRMEFVPEPSFASAERRSLLLPVALAVAALALAVGIAVHLFPATTVNIAQVRVQVLPVQVAMAADTKVVGANTTEGTLFIAETLRIDNQLRQPIFLDNFQITLTDAQGATLSESAVKTADLPALEKNFPVLQPVMLQPLLREATIPQGQATQGTILFSLPVPQALWAARKDALVTVSLYHLNPVYQTIPKP
jgi:hypothetical protein